MNISELCLELAEIEAEHGDIEVYCECDHGQWPENVFSVNGVYVSDDGEIVGYLDDYDLSPEDLEHCKKAVNIN